MKRVLASVSVLVIPVVSLVWATPASAASYSTSVSCVGSALTLSSNNIATAPGDTIDMTNTTGVGLARTTIASATGPFTLSAAGPSVTGTFTVVGAAGGLITFKQDPSGPCANATITFTFTGGGGGGGGGASSSGSQIPPTVLQQFALPGAGTCDANQPQGLDLAGVPSGGWSTSWAQWPHGGKGGTVCTRTLAYSSSLGTWAVS